MGKRKSKSIGIYVLPDVVDAWRIASREEGARMSSYGAKALHEKLQSSGYLSATGECSVIVQFFASVRRERITVACSTNKANAFFRITCKRLSGTRKPPNKGLPP